MLEQLRNAKEKGGGLLSGESLPCVQKIYDPGQEGPAFPGRYRRFVEDAGFLYDGGFVVVESCGCELGQHESTYIFPPLRHPS